MLKLADLRYFKVTKIDPHFLCVEIGTKLLKLVESIQQG